MNKIIRPVFVLLCYGLLFWIVFSALQTDPMASYISTLKEEHVETENVEQRSMSSSDHEKTIHLKQMIRELAEEMDEEPIDAKIDPVYKKIPGYNGIRVNQQKTLERAQKNGQVTPETLYIEELEPETGLDDLPPEPIYKGNDKKPMVSFMVNVAWGTEHVQDMLDIFAEYNIKSTFFLDGSWLKRNQEVAQQIVDEGHEIGNHAYSHPDLRHMDQAQIKEELQKTEDLIQELGTQSYVFAPPAGAYDDRVVKIAAAMNMQTIMWTLDTIDWRHPPSGKIIQRIVPELDNGSLILMHPTASTVRALPTMIEAAFEEELLPGTVSELLSPQRRLSIVRLGEL